MPKNVKVLLTPDVEAIPGKERGEPFVFVAASGGERALDVEEMRRLDSAGLVAHATRLQERCGRLESDYRALTWELLAKHEELAYFSNATSLAHKLGTSDARTVAGLAVAEVPRHFACSFAALYFYNPGTDLVELSRASCPTPDRMALHRYRDADHFVVRLLFERSDPYIVEYADALQLFVSEPDGKPVVDDVASADAWHALLGSQAIVYPLLAGKGKKNEVLGGLLIGNGGRRLVGKDMEVSALFADLLAFSLYNARLVRQLNDLIIVDPLTQLYNRRHLTGYMKSAVAQARRQNHLLSVAMIDIDHFKNVNDTCGHLYGDQVLSEVGAIIKGTIRCDVDVAARYGGEEFMVVMPFCDAERALATAERIRRNVKNRMTGGEAGQVPVTCSVGVAELMADDAPENLIERADAALYRAKKKGRDQVNLAPSSRPPWVQR